MVSWGRRLLLDCDYNDIINCLHVSHIHCLLGNIFIQWRHVLLWTLCCTICVRATAMAKRRRKQSESGGARIPALRAGKKIFYCAPPLFCSAPPVWGAPEWAHRCAVIVRYCTTSVKLVAYCIFVYFRKTEIQIKFLPDCALCISMMPRVPIQYMLFYALEHLIKKLTSTWNHNHWNVCYTTSAEVWLELCSL